MSLSGIIVKNKLLPVVGEPVTFVRKDGVAMKCRVTDQDRFGLVLSCAGREYRIKTSHRKVKTRKVKVKVGSRSRRGKQARRSKSRR